MGGDYRRDRKDRLRMAEIKLLKPVDGPVSCDFGVKGTSWKTGFHTGVDFAVPKGTEIRNCLGGQVQLSGRETNFGLRIWVLSKMPFGLMRILYGHCSKLLFNQDEIVEKGQVIALSGNSGERHDKKLMKFHLHTQWEEWPSRKLIKPTF